MIKEVHVKIGMRWNHPSVEVISRETERFLSWLMQFETTHLNPGDRIPVNWNLPSYPYLEKRSRNLDDLILEIKTRIQNKSDMPISMGYSGGAHPLLTLAELKKECKWGISNPWGSGIKDVFGKISPCIIPLSPDIIRSESINCYSKNQFTAIGINKSVIDQFYFESMDQVSRDALRLLLFYPLSLDFVMHCKRDSKKVLENCHYTLPFFFDCMYLEEVVKVPFDFKPFSELLLMLMAKYTVKFTSFDSIPPFSPDKEITYTYEVTPFDKRNILPQHPVWKQNMALIEQDRIAKKKKDIHVKDILTKISPLQILPPGSKGIFGKRNYGFTPGSFPPEDRINLADMQGEITLAGEEFSVRFNGGRIKNFLYNKKKILAGELSKSYFKLSHGYYESKSSSAFSIAGDRCRGLREIRKIVIQPDEPYGTQLTDYIFTGDFPYLIVTTKVNYPYFSPHTDIEEFAFFEIPLFYFHRDKPIDLHVYSEKSHTSYSLNPEARTFSVTGTAFVFSSDSIRVILGFPETKGPELQVLGIRIKKNMKGYCLYANAGGSYFRIPGAYCSRVTEIFSFYIGLHLSLSTLEKSSTIESIVNPFPARVLAEIPTNCVIHDQERTV